MPDFEVLCDVCGLPTMDFVGVPGVVCCVECAGRAGFHDADSRGGACDADGCNAIATIGAAGSWLCGEHASPKLAAAVVRALRERGDRHVETYEIGTTLGADCTCPRCVS